MIRVWQDTPERSLVLRSGPAIDCQNSGKCPEVAEPEGGNKGDSRSAGSATPTEITGSLTLGGREPLLGMLECCCLAGKDTDGGSWGLGAAPPSGPNQPKNPKILNPPRPLNSGSRKDTPRERETGVFMPCMELSQHFSTRLSPDSVTCGSIGTLPLEYDFPTPTTPTTL